MNSLGSLGGAGVFGGEARLTFAGTACFEGLDGESVSLELSEVGFLFLCVHSCFVWYVCSMTHQGSKVKW